MVPHSWMAAAEDRSFVARENRVPGDDLAFEYMLNRLRLAEPIPLPEFEARTGLDVAALETALGKAVELGLLEREREALIRTERGARYLDDLQALFLPSRND